MTPPFLLHLSTNSIALDQRSEAGEWVRLGAVDPDNPKLPEALAHLKALARPEGTDPDDVLIVLPSDQVKRLQLDASNLTPADVKAALEGQTPYDTAELCIDWFNTPQGTAVAAVTHDTLIEAGDFAKSFDFNALGFVALPDEGWGNQFAVFHPDQAPSEMPARPMQSYISAEKLGVPSALEPALPSVPLKKPTDVLEQLEKLAPSMPTPPLTKFSPSPKPKQFAAIATGTDVPSDKAPRLGAAKPSTAANPTAAPDVTASVTEDQTPKPWTTELQPELPFSSRRPNRLQAFMATILIRWAVKNKQAAQAKAPINTLQAQVGGKPRFLALILTTLLLIFMLTIAAWAATAGRDTLARWFGFGGSDTEMMADLGASETKPPLEARSEDSVEQRGKQITIPSVTVQKLLPNTTTALATNIQTASPEEPAPSDQIAGAKFVSDPKPITPAEQRFSDTGVWTVPPISPFADTETTDADVAEAALDPKIGQADAQGLPATMAQDPASVPTLLEKNPTPTQPEPAALPPPVSANFDISTEDHLIARSIPLERIVLMTSLRPKDRPKSIGLRYSARWLRSLDAPKRDKQWACLAEALYFEARGELVKGQFGVAEVILNRVASPEFPNSICRVVNQGTGRKHACQFSYTCDGKPEHIVNGAAYDQVGRVARVMMDGGTRRLTEGATYYHTKSVRPSWARRFEHTATIGVHKFYKPVRRVAKK